MQSWGDLMNLTYAVADLHGAHDLLELALSAVDRHAAAASAGTRAVVFLGDYVDRGPGSRQIIERLMFGPPDGWRWLCLKGNHEDIMLAALGGHIGASYWREVGGAETLASYGSNAQIADEMRAAVPAEHVAWIRALPPLAVDKHRVFVHAGVDPTLRLEDQDEQTLIWSRDSNGLGHDGRFVVHGHTPHRNGPVTNGQSIDLDTLAWHTGRLVIGVFDDDQKGGPVDRLEVRRHTAGTLPIET